MDEVFKALGDPTRRELLDRLFEQDGQTLSALESGVADVALRRDEAPQGARGGDLVVTRRRGREKLHYLNPVPIRLVYDRWVSKYAEPWASALTGLKRELEEEDVAEEFDVPHRLALVPDRRDAAGTAVFEIYIKTTPERLWEAITDPR